MQTKFTITKKVNATGLSLAKWLFLDFFLFDFILLEAKNLYSKQINIRGMK